MLGLTYIANGLSNLKELFNGFQKPKLDPASIIDVIVNEKWLEISKKSGSKNKCYGYYFTIDKDAQQTAKLEKCLRALKINYDKKHTRFKPVRGLEVIAIDLHELKILFVQILGEEEARKMMVRALNNLDVKDEAKREKYYTYLMECQAARQRQKPLPEFGKS